MADRACTCPNVSLLPSDGLSTVSTTRCLPALDARLRPAGLKVQRNTLGITIRPATDNAREARARLAHLNDDADGFNQGTARVLYAVDTGDISGRETRGDHHVHVGALRNRDAIHIGHGDGSRYTLTDYGTSGFDVQ